jgi:hypothetical protein
VLALAGGVAAAAFAGCGSDTAPPVTAVPEGVPGLKGRVNESTPQGGAASAADATATATPTPFAAGHSERALLAGTPWESLASIRHSGVAGTKVMILGGVHGNEPGGWLAAEELASIVPATGSILVLPRANQLAIHDFVRTHDDLGDLNRLYPGEGESTLPMARMAAEIVELAREFRVEVALDLHESWGFYSTREQNGTAFLGQTMTAGVGPRNPDLVRDLVDRANQHITTERDLMVFRDGSAFRRPETAPSDASGNRGRSSLSLGGHVPGLTPILVEMGQEEQALERRVELHLIVANEALSALGVI